MSETLPRRRPRHHMIMNTAHLHLAMATVLLALVGAAAQAARPEYGIRADQPPTGSHIQQYDAGMQSIPINRRYEELSPAERSRLNEWWENIPAGDEPPFPIDGLKPIHDAIYKAQKKLLARGKLFLIATVSPDGKVTSVKAIGSPSPEMTRFAASVLVLTKFKPARCSGRPCQMDFPLRYDFLIQ